MSTTTRARYWAIGSAIGLSLALPVPTHANGLDADAFAAIIVAQAGPGGEREGRERHHGPQRGNDRQGQPQEEGERRQRGEAAEEKERPGRGGDNRKQAEGEQRQRGQVPQPGNASQRPQGQAAESNERRGRGEAENRRQPESEQRQRGQAPQPGSANQRPQGQAAESNERRGRGDAENRRQPESEQRQRGQAPQPGNANHRPQGQVDQSRRENEHPRGHAAPNAGDQRLGPQQGHGAAHDRRTGQDDAARSHGGDNRADRSDRQRGAASESRPGRGGHIDEIRKQRRERREADGRVIIEEPGNRRIIRDGRNTIIRHDESERFRRQARNVDVKRGKDNERITTITRPNGVTIVTVEDSNGRLLRRTRRGRDGREVVLIDNHRHGHHQRHHGHDGLAIFLDLAMPKVHIDRRHYIVEADIASEDDLYDAFIAPPITEIERGYSLDEIRYNYPLRARMRSVNLNTINFAFGSWEVDDQAFDKLAEVARAMNRALDRNPDEIFLIEGHTDAVGSDEDNLTLSDRRAETVAIILTEEFGVPAENLTTQGYGEQYLLVDTQEAERRNRRVTVRRITPLLGQNR